MTMTTTTMTTMTTMMTTTTMTTEDGTTDATVYEWMVAVAAG